MIGIVVAAHGDLATALIDTATGVVPGEPQPAGVAINVEEDSATYEGRLFHAVGEAEEGDGVLVLTDMFGGTPSNVGMTLHEPGKVEVLTGVNLPMLIKALQIRGRTVSLEEAAHEICSAGTRAIVVATEILGGRPSGSEVDA